MDFWKEPSIITRRLNFVRGGGELHKGDLEEGCAFQKEART